MRLGLRIWNIEKMLQDYYRELKFGFHFLGFTGFFLFVYSQIGEALPLLSTHSTATSVANWLNILGVEALVEGNIVSLPNFIYRIVPECTPAFGLIVYYATILAYPAPWKKRLVGLIIGTPVILFVNMIRLVSISFIGMARPGIADMADFYVYPALFLIIIVSMFWVWLDEVVR